MAESNTAVLAFNRGLFDKRGLARMDLGRMALSAETQTNFMPFSLGAMMLRCGMEYITGTKGNNQAIYLPFIFSTTDTALVELTDSVMRVLVSDTLISRASVSTAFTNGTFTTDLTGWTDDDDAGAASTHHASDYLQLIGTASAVAKRYQELTVAGGDQNVEHALRIEIIRGPVTLRVGSTQGDDDFISETQLEVGTHSLAFTPTGASAFVQFEANTLYASLVDSVAIESSGTMEITTPWATADLPLIRIDQSGDVIFIASESYQQRRIERRATNSWSIVKYVSPDGPFRNSNVGPVTITSDALTGDATLTASAPLFKSTHVDGIFQITSTGQQVDTTFSVQNTFGNSIEVTGTSTGERRFTITVTDIGTSTVTLQRSIDEGGTWTDVTSYTTDQVAINYDDGLSNQIVEYRLGVKTGELGGGDTIDTTLLYPNGGISGVVRITAVASSTSASAIVLSPLGSTDAVTDWAEGVWSGRRGWPSATKIYESRLWWAGKDRIVGSVSDAYDSYDPSFEGDAGPINRTIGFGPVDRINWLNSVQRLMIGAQGSEMSVRSSSDMEPLTPANFNIKDPSTQGCADVASVKVDSSVLFVQRSGVRVFELSYQFEPNDYSSRDLTIHAQQVGETGIKRIAVQRQPDTRVHFVRTDGKVAVLLFNKAEDLSCWILVETDGVVEDVVVLPGTTEDAVYYAVKRTINSTTVRFLEKWALTDECALHTTIYNSTSTTSITGLDYANDTVVTVRDSNGGKVENLTVTDGAITLSAAATYAHITPSFCKLGDAFETYDGTATTSITGLSHLEGESVVVWADGQDVGSHTVSSGAITLSTAAEKVMVGLPYISKFKGAKLAFTDPTGGSLNQVKKISHLGLILRDTHYQGLKYGPSFDYLEELPQVEKGASDIAADTCHEAFDEMMIEFSGEYDTDSRVCLQAAAPRPCTVLAAVVKINE